MGDSFTASDIDLIEQTAEPDLDPNDPFDDDIDDLQVIDFLPVLPLNQITIDSSYRSGKEVNLTDFEGKWLRVSKMGFDLNVE